MSPEHNDVPAPAYRETEMPQAMVAPMPIEPDHAYTQPQQPQPPQQPFHSQYPIATPLHALQSAPAPVDCPACGQREMTQVLMESGNTTHAWAAILCFCLCIGCLPYCTSSLKDANHHCAKCGVLLATWHNSGRIEVVHGRQTVQPKKEKQKN